MHDVDDEDDEETMGEDESMEEDDSDGRAPPIRKAPWLR
jgi:hypothetical protein